MSTKKKKKKGEVPDYSDTRKRLKKMGALEPKPLLDVNPEGIKALESSKIPHQRLGQGNLYGKFYYGTSLTYKGNSVSAVITDDKQIFLGINKVTFKCKKCSKTEELLQFDLRKIKYPKQCNCKEKKFQDWEIVKIHNQIKDDFGLNFRTEFNDDSIDYVWSTESIKRYLEEDYANKELREIFEQIVFINEKYIDHLDKESHNYVACWIIGTYCFSLFEQFGRLYNRAERGSGKTKQAKIIKFLSFNPLWVTKSTESSIFRDSEATCGTFIVDNMDKLHEDFKRTMEHHIETGWMNDATYRLTNLETQRTMKFLSYSPMALNNIFGLDENTIDKTFEIPMLKSINKKINRTKPKVKSEDWETIRNSIRYWMLDNWKKVAKEYNEISATFSGREFDVVEGVLTIAKVIGEDVYKSLEKYCNEKMEEQMVDLENNNSYLVFSNIWMKFHENPLLQIDNVFLGDIADELFDKFNPHLLKGSDQYNNKKKGFSKYIGKIIRSVPMFRRGGLSQGKTYVTIERKSLEKYMKLQHFINDDGTLLTSTSPTNSTKLLTSTPKRVDVVEQVDVVEDEIQVEEKVQLPKITAKEVGGSGESVDDS